MDIAEDDETVINNDVESIKEPQTTEIVWVSTDIKEEPSTPTVVNELKKM